MQDVRGCSVIRWQAAHLNQRISTLDEELRCVTETKVQPLTTPPQPAWLFARVGVAVIGSAFVDVGWRLQARLEGDHRELQMRCTHAEADLSNLRSECDRLR